MEALKLLFTSDIGLMSLFTIVAIIGMAVWFAGRFSISRSRKKRRTAPLKSLPLCRRWPLGQEVRRLCARFRPLDPIGCRLEPAAVGLERSGRHRRTPSAGHARTVE